MKKANVRRRKTRDEEKQGMSDVSYFPMPFIRKTRRGKYEQSKQNNIERSFLERSDLKYSIYR